MRRTRKGYAASVRRQSRQRLRNCPVEEKKCFGGSVRTSADLLPPAGEGWHSRAVIRDGNALPLGLSKPGEVPDTFRSAFTRKGYAASPRKGDATSP